MAQIDVITKNAIRTAVQFNGTNAQEVEDVAKGHGPNAAFTADSAIVNGVAHMTLQTPIKTWELRDTDWLVASGGQMDVVRDLQFYDQFDVLDGYDIQVRDTPQVGMPPSGAIDRPGVNRVTEPSTSPTGTN